MSNDRHQSVGRIDPVGTRRGSPTITALVDFAESRLAAPCVSWRRRAGVPFWCIATGLVVVLVRRRVSRGD